MSTEDDRPPIRGARWVFAVLGLLAVGLLVPAFREVAWVLALGMVGLAVVLVLLLHSRAPRSGAASERTR